MPGYSYGNLLTHGLNLAGEDAGSDYEAMLKVAINLTYSEILAATDSDLERREFSLTTVSGISQYGMPLYVRRVLNIEDTDRRRALEIIPRQVFDADYAGTTQSGPPERAYKLGAFGVQKQPATAGTLTAVSSSSSDGDTFSILIRGFSSGVDVRESLALNGTSAVTSANSYDTANGIQRIVLVPASGSAFSGNVTVKDADANTLAVFPPYYGESPTYEWYELHPTPASAITYTVRCEARKPPLALASDWPEIADDFHDLLIDGPAAMLLETVGKSRQGALAAQRFARRIAEYSGDQSRQPGMQRTMADVMPYAGIGAYRQRYTRPHVTLTAS